MQNQPRYVKLIMVSAENRNKYYEMTWDGVSPSFSVKYGRLESTATTGSYPISQWNTKYNEKVKKGYKDVTEYVAVTVTTQAPTTQDLDKITDQIVDKFMSLMKKYTDGLVSKTYSVKAVAVTQKQVDDAQKLLNELSTMTKKSQKEINDKLIELYMIIPRYMGHVSHHLLPSINLDKTLVQEQDNLDAMASQVAMIATTTKPKKKKVEKNTILDVLGIKMKEAKPGKDVKYLIDQISSTGRRVESFFEVDKPSENKRFEDWLSKQNDKSTRILIHGTRCTSVIPILEQGLKIRPAGNFQFSGKVYGDGNYFSEVVNKSLGYVGHDNDKILLVYEVHTGNPFVYDGWYRGNSFTLNYKNLKERGFDSTYVKAGHGLLNTEIIAYKEEQCRIKYIIWLK